MFLRNTGDIGYYLKRTSLIKYLDERNLRWKTRFLIKRLGKKINDTSVFISFKYWVLWRWIYKNFDFTEKFMITLRKNIKKLDLNISSREETFLNEMDELLFNSWRPLKEVPVKFELSKKEKVNLVQSNINIHKVTTINLEPKLKMKGQFDAYFSNQKIYLTDSNQVLKFEIRYKEIKQIVPKRYGVLVELHTGTYLFRGKNRLLTYVLIQRMVPELNLNIAEIDNLYDYFDFANNFLSRIN
ncbi:hypothetical protein SHELI_v1c01570 [Spiroplasma helicoides]|uniref:Uncharacterized protein n=1 Tax=Spiroplasma helicoides TaxID=216938 RepID=A0A1B3SJK8_9MOLU|nr:hypothetical protein [Spiroplasma helicoides]AOG60112.1 hypothetical protein SHELI_v1c01570 [Spiroplasma helicoides]